MAARKFTRSKDGTPRADVSATIRLEADEILKLTYYAKKHGKTLTEYLSDCLADGIYRALEAEDDNERWENAQVELEERNASDPNDDGVIRID